MDCLIDGSMAERMDRCLRRYLDGWLVRRIDEGMTRYI